MLIGPDRQLLYDSSTKYWDFQYLPPVLQKVTPQDQHRLFPGQEEKELCTFMATIMAALVHHHDHCDEYSPLIQFYRCYLPSIPPLYLWMWMMLHPLLQPPSHKKHHLYLSLTISPPLCHPILHPCPSWLLPPCPSWTNPSTSFPHLQDLILAPVCYMSQQTYSEVNDTYSEGGPHKEMLHPQSKVKVMNKRWEDWVTTRQVAD